MIIIYNISLLGFVNKEKKIKILFSQIKYFLFTFI